MSKPRTREPKPEECDTCGHATKPLVFHKGQGRADGLKTDVPWTMADHWLCRLCETGLGFEVHRGRVNHALVRALNVVLEAIAPQAAEIGGWIERLSENQHALRDVIIKLRRRIEALEAKAKL